MELNSNNRFKQYLIDNGIMQTWIASFLGTRRMTVNNWANGNSVPDSVYIIPLSAALKLTEGETLALFFKYDDNYKLVS